MIIKKGKIAGIRYEVLWNKEYDVYCLGYYHVGYVKDFYHRSFVLYWDQYQYYIHFWYRSQRKDKPHVFKTLLGNSYRTQREKNKGRYE